MTGWTERADGRGGPEGSGLLGMASGDTAHVAGHVLERLDEGRWELRCGQCLALVARLRRPPGLRPRPGLPVDGALVLPGTSGWPQVSLAWGFVPTDCDPSPGPRTILARRRTAARAVFRAGLRTVDAEPVLLPGGLWVAVAPVTAGRVTTQAFGVRSRGRVEPCDRPACV